jgi:hypothetical protein
MARTCQPGQKFPKVLQLIVFEMLMAASLIWRSRWKRDTLAFDDAAQVALEITAASTALH